MKKFINNVDDLLVEPAADRGEEAGIVGLVRRRLGERKARHRHEQAGGGKRPVWKVRCNTHGRQADLTVSRPAAINGIRAGGYGLRTTDGEIEEPPIRQIKYTAATMPMTITAAPRVTQRPRRFSMMWRACSP